jgi:hypothetical protein
MRAKYRRRGTALRYATLRYAGNRHCGPDSRKHRDSGAILWDPPEKQRGAPGRGHSLEAHPNKPLLLWIEFA